MKRINPWKVSTIALATALGLVVGGGYSTEAEAKPPTEILKTLGMLEAAKQQLFKAPKDEGGHRQKAIETTRMAIAELRLAAFGKDAPKYKFPK